MPRITTSDGRVLEWTGLRICYCSLCERLFNSVFAFDAHIKYDKAGQHPQHDYSNMPRNAKGYLCTSLRDEEVLKKLPENKEGKG